MATNVRVFGSSPRVPVDACAGAHFSGDLGFESGFYGIVVETNIVGQPNTLIERCSCVLPVPSSVTPGTRLFWDWDAAERAALNVSPTVSPTATFPLGLNGATIQAAPQRATAVPSTLTTSPLSADSATPNILIGTAYTAAYVDGLSTVAVIELAPEPQPILSAIAGDLMAPSDPTSSANQNLT